MACTTYLAAQPAAEPGLAHFRQRDQERTLVGSADDEERRMSLQSSAVPADANWPPEVPPYRHPGPPSPYGPPSAPPPPAPVPIVPSWYEAELPSRRPSLEERLLERRTVLVSGELDATLADRVTAQLLLLAGPDDRPVELHLSCPGGDLDACLALADAVDLVAAPVHAIVRGSLGGPAIAVLCAAAERAAHRHAVLTLSLPTATGQGTADQLGVQAEQHEHAVARLRDLVAAATGLPTGEVESDLRTGRVLTAADALAYGLVQRTV